MKGTTMHKFISIDDATIYGVDLATKLNGALDKAAQAMQKAIIVAAQDVAAANDDGIVKAVLTGFETFYKDKGLAGATARKSEVKAVFDAVLKTEVSETNLKQLQEFKGGYQEFIELARKLRGVNERAPKTPKLGLTNGQLDKVELQVEKATPAQLEIIAETAVQQIVKQPQNATANLVGLQSLRIIESVCQQALASDRVEPAIQKVLQDVFSLVHPEIAKLQEVNQQAILATTKAKTPLAEVPLEQAA
jgi:hypothetical protein